MPILANLAIDDVNPAPDYNLRDDIDHFRRLYELYGLKANLFVPTCYHKKYPLTAYIDWVEWIKSFPFFQFSAHGCYHINVGHEQEFLDLHNQDALDRFILMMSHWQDLCIKPRVFRFPGWGASESAYGYALKIFDRVMGHPLNNDYPSRDKDQTIEWRRFDLIHDGLREYNPHNDLFLFHSHIFSSRHHNSLFTESGKFERNWNILEQKIKILKPEWKFLEELIK